MARARRRLAPAPVAQGNVALFVECGDLVLAIEADRVERILLTAETVQRPPDRDGAPPLVDAGSGWVPCWDVHALLGWPGTATSWVIARAPRNWPFAAFALGTGRCVCVRPMPKGTPLPATLLRARARAFPAAFRTSSIPELATYATGVVLDPTQLLDRAEIDRAALADTVEARW